MEAGDVPMFWLYDVILIHEIHDPIYYDMCYRIFCGSCLDLTPKIPPISVLAGSIRCLELSSDSGTLC